MTRKRRTSNCPACGGPVTFGLSTALVTICDFCSAVVARGDKQLEDHGKVADLVETNSPVERGMQGTFRKKSFEIAGRVQYQHPAGGVWNEWYLQFPGDRVGWLAEAQGKFYLTMPREISSSTEIPDYDSLTPGDRITIADGMTLAVAEKGVARAASASGSIPWDFRPQAEHRFADLHAEDRGFATIDYSQDHPQLFVGREVSLKELKLQGGNGEGFAASDTISVGGLQLSCPQCAGPLTLHAPDQSLRVSCPSCHALLDCQHGNLSYLQTLHGEVEKPLIPLGSTGSLMNDEYTVIGFMVRYAVYEGRDYPWTEYLLYQPEKGFRWLVRNKGHWSFVEPLSVADLSATRGDKIRYQGTTFRVYDRGIAYVRYVVGEFYWKVSATEQVVTADYIAPPRMLSLERSDVQDKSGELNVSLGTYLEKETVEQAFKIKELPSPWGTGTIQPKPSYGDVWGFWLLFGAVLFGLKYLFGAISVPVEGFFFVVSLLVISAPPALLFFLNHLFEVNRWKDSEFSPYASSDE
ncbi:MAG: DUF4178 domain-containing protein [Planctomyces sp.]